MPIRDIKKKEDTAMPELPDVEAFRRYFDSRSLNQKIGEVHSESSILDGISKGRLASELRGKEFKGSRRHGKNLFAEIDGGSFLVFHFGMTGFLKYYGQEEEKPDHVRMEILFENGHRLAFDCLRKLGRIRFAKDYDSFIEEKGLGIDALSESLTQKEFKTRLSRSRGYIKSVLMNQSVIAGIGNVYADEILYHARIHPGRKPGDLDEKDFENIYGSMHDVLEKAIAADADPEKMPEDFLLHRRKSDAPCPCGGKMKKFKLSGRNGYFCPECQR